MRDAADDPADLVMERPADDVTHARVERFYAREALILDHRRFGDWLELFEEGAPYEMATVVNGHPRNERNRPETTFMFRDTRRQLEQRIARLATGIAWSEEPPSRTRRVISNVLVSAPADGLLVACSNFVVFRSRQESDNTIFIGGRVDRLRDAERSFSVASRTITIDQATLQAHNLSIFF